MTDTTITASDNTPEYVAYLLLAGIAAHENKSVGGTASRPFVRAEKQWMLDNYAECLETVEGRRNQS